jgi:hypothetical protein
MLVLGAKLAQRLSFIEHSALGINQRFLLIYGVTGKAGTSN